MSYTCPQAPRYFRHGLGPSLSGAPPPPLRRRSALQAAGGFEKLYKVKTPFLNVSPAVVNRYYVYGLPRQKSDRFLVFDSKTVGEKKEE